MFLNGASMMAIGNADSFGVMDDRQVAKMEE
jgi:hypothetical protein